jgi:hypothetical protein
MTTKCISFLRISTPNSIPMWGDPVTIFDSNGIPIPRVKGINLVEIKNTIFCMGRSWPNPYKPSGGKPFDLYYGAVALGVFDGECIGHDRFGKCILINDGKTIPALYPNPNYDMLHNIRQVFIHRPDPDSDNWPGSAGCLTVERSAVDDFFSQFRLGEKIKLQIAGKTNGYI